MEGQPANEAPSEGRPLGNRGHRRAVLALVVLGTLFAFLAIFALWANRQALDTENWAETSSELLEHPAVRGEVAAFLTDELYANVDVQGRIRQVLPDRADQLAGPAAGGLKQLVERGGKELLARPIPQRLWEQANRRAHARLVQVLEGGGEVVSTQDGEVTLDLKSLLGATQERVGVGGRVAGKLPEDAATITVFRSDQLELAQDVVRLLKALAVLFVLLSLGLFALAVYIARGWRREALRACGFGLIVAGTLALLARSLAGAEVVGALATTESVRPAADATWSIATSLLVDAAVATIAYGVVIVCAAWLAGPTHAAVATRSRLAPWLRDPRFAYGALAILLLLLIAWGPTPATRRVVPLLLMIVLVVVGMEALRRQVAREHPDATREEGVRRLRERVAAIGSRLRPAGARSGPAGAESDYLEQLARLGKLRDDGVLEPDEFQREKARILDQAAAQGG